MLAAELQPESKIVAPMGAFLMEGLTVRDYYSLCIADSIKLCKVTKGSCALELMEDLDGVVLYSPRTTVQAAAKSQGAMLCQGLDEGENFAGFGYDIVLRADLIATRGAVLFGNASRSRSCSITVASVENKVFTLELMLCKGQKGRERAF